MTKNQVESLRQKFGVFETVTPAQNLALQALVKKIQESLRVAKDQVYPLTEVSYKNPTEGTTAVWKSKND